MPKIETTSKVSLKLTSRINLRRWEARTKPWILDVAHMTPRQPASPERANKRRQIPGNSHKRPTKNSDHEKLPKEPKSIQNSIPDDDAQDPRKKANRKLQALASAAPQSIPPRHTTQPPPPSGRPTAARITTK